MRGDAAVEWSRTDVMSVGEAPAHALSTSLPSARKLHVEGNSEIPTLLHSRTLHQDTRGNRHTLVLADCTTSRTATVAPVSSTGFNASMSTNACRTITAIRT